jgi:hypothetical protein
MEIQQSIKSAKRKFKGAKINEKKSVKRPTHF